MLETADPDSSSSSKGRKSVGRLDREKEESSDWGRDSISMVTTAMCFFFFPVPTPIFTLLISSSYFLHLLMSLSLAVTPPVICSWFLNEPVISFAAFDKEEINAPDLSVACMCICAVFITMPN